MVFGKNHNSTYTKCIIRLLGEQQQQQQQQQKEDKDDAMNGDVLTLVKDAVNLFGEMGRCPVELVEQETKREIANLTAEAPLFDDDADDYTERDPDGDEPMRAANNNNEEEEDDDEEEEEEDEIRGMSDSVFARNGFVKDKVDSGLLFYEKYFLQEFVRSAKRRCLREMEAMLGKVPMIEFVGCVRQRIEHERETCRAVLFPTSFDKVYPVVLKALVEVHAGNYCSELRSILEEYEGEADVRGGVDVSMRVGDLRLVYDVLSKTKFGLLMLQSTFSTFVEKTGKQKVEALIAKSSAAAAGSGDLPGRFARLVVTMWRNYADIVAEQFCGDTEVGKSLKDAFRSFINASYKDSSFNAGEALAKYLDSVLKKSAKGTPAVASADGPTAEAAIAALADLFPLVDDKDVFFALYSRSLSKRLITGTSASKELEQRVIKEVITSDNKEYFLKFNGMFEDLENSAKTTADFRASAEWKQAKAQGPLPKPVVQLLSSSFWALPQLTIDLRLPQRIARAEAAFEAFFTAKNVSKKLVWAHNFGKAEVAASSAFFGPANQSLATPPNDSGNNSGGGGSGGYLITAPISQVAVLDLFNTEDSLTYAQISEKTLLTGQHLDSAVYPFLILHMLTAVAPEGTAAAAMAGSFFAPGTVFTLNKAFVGKKAKIVLGLINPSSSAGAAKLLVNTDGSRTAAAATAATTTTTAVAGGGNDNNGSAVPMVAAAGDEESAAAVDKFVAKQRLEMTKACIVRVMKAEKEITHSNLFSKVSTELQSRFRLTSTVFKKALDYLLDEEYVARSKKEKDLYSYI